MKITNFELKVVRFSSDDVIATSLYYAPAAAYNAATGASYGSGYVEFEGSMTGYDSAAGGWYVTPHSYNVAADEYEMEGLKSGGSLYMPEAGITVDMSSMSGIAQQAYDAYGYEGGLYTKGATFYESYWQ